jgi:uncharacterized protein YqjF (DUF2071 family)
MLPKHPVPMQALFLDCFLVNFGVNPEAVASYLPKGLVPKLHHGEAYISVVIAKLEKMRPAFLPKSFGITYNQVVYRLVVNKDGERGVYFLRSDADNSLMCFLGNMFSYFKFHRANIDIVNSQNRLEFSLKGIDSDVANIHSIFDIAGASLELPASSKFQSLDEAKIYLVELFTAFGCMPNGKTINRVKIKRGEWQVSLVADHCAEYNYLKSGLFFPTANCRLDSVFYVQSIPYYWNRLEH